MKKILLSLLSVLLILLLPGMTASAEKTIPPAYVYYDDSGLPKYWLDFTGAAADDLVLHGYFYTDSWYESSYVLDFTGAVPHSHQDTYRIESVWDRTGADVSSWFRTLSLEIGDDEARLYIERDPVTLAGGPDSTILDGLYEMTPADAGVVYEYAEDGQLKSWLVLNADDVLLSFSDGSTWHLETGEAEGYTAKIRKIVTSSGKTVPFQSMSLTYDQGTMRIEADAGAGFSGVFVYTPRVFLQRSGCSAEEIGRMAQMYYFRHHLFYPPIADVTETGEGEYSVHLYEVTDLGDGISHTATSAWYTVNDAGIGTDDLFGTPVDLRM